MNDELSKYYELLGVAPGTSGRELKQAYHDMAKVWHPDRFSHDPRLQRKAQEKLKEINDAYEQLTSGTAARRTRPPSAPGASYTPPAATVRHKRPRFILPTAVVFCAAFVAALGALVPSGARLAREQSPPAVPQDEARPVEEGARPAEEGQGPDGGAGQAAGRPTRGKERAGRQPQADAANGGEHGAAQGAPPPLRPLPTVTVTIDAVNGLLATRDCPTVSRMTYPAGAQPRRYCDVPHKTKF